MAFRDKKKKQKVNLSSRHQNVSYIAQLVSRGRYELAKQMLKSDMTLISATDEQNLTPLHHSCHEACIPLAKFLLKRGAQITERDQRGWNCLHCAGANQGIPDNFVTLSRLLLQHDSADRALMAKTDSGSTYLHFMLANQQINEDEMAELLRTSIRLRADVDAQNETGEAPLHRAALNGRANMCRVLVAEAGFFFFLSLSFFLIYFFFVFFLCVCVVLQN